jgi:DNA invertase Pin-like site-specific DNA recombinase
MVKPSSSQSFQRIQSAKIYAPQWRYFVYVRKSSEPDDRQALSIESQKKELLSRFEALSIVEIIEESRTAKAPGRPKFEAMMKRLEKGEADGLIAWHPDRLSRNSVDAGRLIYDLDLGKIKDLKFAGYNFENNPEGKWMLSVILSQSKYFVDKLPIDVHRGLKTKLEMGWRPGVAPIGYLNNLAAPKGLRTIIPDPERFALIRQMWDLMLTGAYSPPCIPELATRGWGLRTVDQDHNI